MLGHRHCDRQESSVRRHRRPRDVGAHREPAGLDGPVDGVEASDVADPGGDESLLEESRRQQRQRQDDPAGGGDERLPVAGDEGEAIGHGGHGDRQQHG